MKFQLKDYQEKAVDNILKLTKTYLDIGGSTKEIVFKSPTGSGKTIMMAGFLDKLKNEDIGDHAFVWISVNKLHNQSKESLEKVLGVGAFNFYNLENVREKLNKNDILFINWESITKKAKRDNQDKGIQKGDYTNIFMSENETNRNLPNFINNTKKDNRKIVLIIDESHLHLSEDTEKLIQDVIKPDLRIEVSATPKKSSTVEIPLSEVIDAGMVKEEVVINEKFGDLNLLESTSDEIIIKQGLEKREKLKELYRTEKNVSNINPLVLIQVPGNTEKTSVLEKDAIEKVKEILNKDYNINTENKKLAIWLSEEKVNLENIKDFNSGVDVLIFKQAIATGWDCPRAQVLVMFREIKSITFEIQTVGRIMRMPELKPYSNHELNKAYVYTNFGEINIEQGEASKYIKVKLAKFRSDLENIVLPGSTYLPRLDYNDLEPTKEFNSIFYNVFLDEIGGKETDFPNILFDSLSDKINTNKEFKTNILLETRIMSIDETIDYRTGYTKTDEKVIDHAFKKQLEKYLSGLNKSRSLGVLKQSFYNFFNHYLGFKNKSHLEIQKIILTNPDFFGYIVTQSLKQFETIRNQYIERKQEVKECNFSIPEFETFGDNYDKRNYKKSAQNPCYIKDDSNLEREFIEQYLEENIEVEYWYKNGVSKEIYFGILYNYEGKQRCFYPDFIVKYKNGSVGIFDTKDGVTASSMETKMKAEALQEYCKNKDNIFGGIIIKNKGIFYLNKNKEYNFVNDNLAGWERI